MFPDFYLFPRCETVLTVRGDTKPRRFSCVFILRLITEALHSWRRQIFIFNRSWTFNGRQEVGDACCGVPAAGRDGPWNRLIFVDMGGYPKIPSVKGKLRAGWWFLLPYIFHFILNDLYLFRGVETTNQVMNQWILGHGSYVDCEDCEGVDLHSHSKSNSNSKARCQDVSSTAHQANARKGTEPIYTNVGCESWHLASFCQKVASESCFIQQWSQATTANWLHVI